MLGPRIASREMSRKHFEKELRGYLELSSRPRVEACNSLRSRGLEKATLTAADPDKRRDNRKTPDGVKVPSSVFVAACPAEAFRQSALHVASMLPGALEKLGGIEQVELAIARHTRLSVQPPCWATWPLSKRGQFENSRGSRTGRVMGEIPARRPAGLTVNLGAGTTGTRFLQCVLKNASRLRCAHNVGFCHRDPRSHAHTSPCDPGATARADKYDYVADSPVPYESMRLLLSHPGNLTAGVILSLRDPFDWVQSRVRHHAYDHCCSIPTAPCGYPSARMAVNPTQKQRRGYAMAFFLYQAWAACIGSSPHLGYDSSHLFAFNLFANRPADQRQGLYNALHRWLGGGAGGHSNHLSSKGAFDQAWETCQEKVEKTKTQPHASLKKTGPKLDKNRLGSDQSFTVPPTMALQTPECLGKCRVSHSNLARGYSSKYFSREGNSVLIWAPTDGNVTTHGSGSRVELTEPKGFFSFSGRHTMNFTQQVLEAGPTGTICIGQIKGQTPACGKAGSVVVMCTYNSTRGEAEAQFKDERCNLVTKSLGRFEIGERIITSFVVDGHEVTVQSNKVALPPHAYRWWGSDYAMHFKVGVYNQAQGHNSSKGGKARLSDLHISHTTAGMSPSRGGAG